MKNKNIYFHIGPGKTGTSAIQAWLQNNQTWLESAGIMYPPHPLDENEVSSGNLLEIIERDVTGEGHLCLEKCQKLIDKFEKSDAHTLLLSSEWFFIRVESILKCNLFKDAKIIAYLRDPIELIESNYNQSVKRHGVFLPQSPIYRGFPSLNVFRKIIQKYSNERVILRPYHSELFHNDNIIADLLHSIGVNDLPEVEKKRINPSYQFEALEFKRILNSFPIEKIQNQLDRTLQQFNEGTSNYTLLNKNFETTSRVQMHQELSAFRDQFGLKHLDSFISKLQITSNKNAHSQQTLSMEDIEKVAFFIQQINPKLYHEILSILTDNTDLYIDTPGFWEWYKSLSLETSLQTKPSRFNWVKDKIKRETSPEQRQSERQVRNASFDEKKLIWSIQNVKQRLNLPLHMRDERVLVSHALFAMEHGQLKFAEQLFLQVLSTAPKNQSALKNINTIRMKLRKEAE
ncbi:hypothetical protein [Vibrio atypicus]|uniref:hypothetical protein n=1 Tax=Vibrio atypicus TaxID=558271 RepID=UPI003735D72D